MYYPECRDLDFGIDSLVNGLGRVGSFDLGRRIDELKEQKAINIVGESNIERKLWWDLGSIDMLMSRSVFLGRTCAPVSVSQYIYFPDAVFSPLLTGPFPFHRVMASRQMQKPFDGTMCLKDSDQWAHVLSNPIAAKRFK
ncbi:hypothetical protein DKX38_014486 [Salix brachista]|uniref:Uncharacterized protein n=1 Tax=Salix brachista TaxID=2182728 RepID=A0A5N5LFX4_9ROSI|nr:hypothetical protein DKX38_014486 [Salix brachista]